MKKTIMMIIAVIFTIGSLSACGADKNNDLNSQAGTGKNLNGSNLKVVTTIFPEYYWVKNIMGEQAEKAEVTNLLDNGVDLHSYQPSIDDILTISECDLFIYVGGESDGWVKDALNQATNKNMEVINLLEVLGDKVKNEEIIEGMEHDHDHDEDHDHDHEEAELDEHVWLSLRNAAAICDEIAGRLMKLDPANADVYKTNVNAYKEKLNELDGQYKAVISGSTINTVLFGDRFPFRYLTDDYGLDYYAAFAGCSAETEASFETVLFLAEKVDELKLHSIMTIEGSDKKIAETIRNSTKTKDQEIRTLNSMQGITSGDIANGMNYLSVMTENLETLKQALK